MQPARVKFMGASGWYTARHFFPSCGKRRLRLGCSEDEQPRSSFQALNSPSALTVRDRPTCPSCWRPLQAGKALPKHSETQPHDAGLAADLTGGSSHPTMSSCLAFCLANAQDSVTVLPTQNAHVASSVHPASQLVSSRAVTGLHDWGMPFPLTCSSSICTPASHTHPPHIPCSTRVCSLELALSLHWVVGQSRAGPFLGLYSPSLCLVHRRHSLSALQEWLYYVRAPAGTGGRAEPGSVGPEAYTVRGAIRGS